jgi:predicted DNA-binding transcriptional regulator AlpA
VAPKYLMRGKQWCVAPCPHFVSTESESGMGRTLADQLVGSRKALTARELSQALCISVISVFRFAKKGIIPAIRIGASVRFCPNAVAAWLREHGGWAQILPSFRIAGSVSAGPLFPFQDGPVRTADLFISGSCVLRAVDLLTAEGKTLIYNAVATGAAQCGPGGAGPRFHCS